MIIECVGSYRCMDGRHLYLIYEKLEDRKNAPQKSFDDKELDVYVNNLVDELGHVTIYEYCGRHKKELYES